MRKNDSFAFLYTRRRGKFITGFGVKEIQGWDNGLVSRRRYGWGDSPSPSRRPFVHSTGIQRQRWWTSRKFRSEGLRKHHRRWLFLIHLTMTVLVRFSCTTHRPDLPTISSSGLGAPLSLAASILRRLWAFYTQNLTKKDHISKDSRRYDAK